MNAASKGIMEQDLPQFEPRLPAFLLDKMSPMEREMFSRLDVNSQQTEHTLRAVLRAHEERQQVVASVAAMQQAHIDHIAQDKRDFGDLREKHAEMSEAVKRCAATLDAWNSKFSAIGKVFSFFFGRKGVATAVLISVLTWLAVEYTKVHVAASRPPATKAQKSQ